MFPTKMSKKNAKISPKQLSMIALQNVSHKKFQWKISNYVLSNIPWKALQNVCQKKISMKIYGTILEKQIKQHKQGCKAVALYYRHENPPFFFSSGIRQF